MRAPGAYIPDMMNYSYNANVYDIFADMLIYDRCFIEPKQQYCIGYAGRRDGLKYKHHSQQIRMKFKCILLSFQMRSILLRPCFHRKLDWVYRRCTNQLSRQ